MKKIKNLKKIKLNYLKKDRIVRTAENLLKGDQTEICSHAIIISSLVSFGGSLRPEFLGIFMEHIINSIKDNISDKRISAQIKNS